MKNVKRYEVGDKVKVIKEFADESYVDKIRELADKFVTIRELLFICNEDEPTYMIKETLGLECDEEWDFDDFDNSI